MLCYLGMSNLFDAPHSWTWCTLEQIYRICCSFPLHQQGFQLTWHRTRILLNNLILMILVWYRWSPTCIALCVSWNVTCLFDALDPPTYLDCLSFTWCTQAFKSPLHQRRSKHHHCVPNNNPTWRWYWFCANCSSYTVVSFKRTAPQLNQPGLLLQTALCKFSSAGALVHSDTLLHAAGKPFSHFANTEPEQPLRQQGTAEAVVCPPSLPQLDWDTPTPQPGQGREKAGSLRVISF